MCCDVSLTERKWEKDYPTNLYLVHYTFQGKKYSDRERADLVNWRIKQLNDANLTVDKVTKKKET